MIEIVFLRNRDEQCWGFTVNENNFAQCTYLRSLKQVPHINFWSCYDKGCIWLVSKYPYAKEKNLISQLPISPELKSSSWLSTVITLHLPVWCCVATRKDKVWSFTAVKVTPFFFSLLMLHRNKLYLQNNFCTKLHNWSCKPRKWEPCLEKGRALQKQGLQWAQGRQWESQLLLDARV